MAVCYAGQQSEAKLQEESTDHGKERKALKIILEQKMQSCVEQIMQGVADMRSQGIAVPTGIPRQAGALLKLIAATVQAMGGTPESAPAPGTVEQSAESQLAADKS